jgi:hypothetical protein
MLGSTQQTSKVKGVSGQGRPKNSKDTVKRDTRTPKIRTSADEDEAALFITKMTWAKQTQKILDDILTPALLSIRGKKNSRMLSTKESEECENIKFAVMAQIEPFSDIDDKMVYSIIKGGNITLSTEFSTVYKKLYDISTAKLNRVLTIEECRNIQIATYSILKE